MPQPSALSLDELRRSVVFCGDTALVLVDPSHVVVEVIEPGFLGERSQVMLGRRIEDWLDEMSGLTSALFGLSGRPELAMLVGRESSRIAPQQYSSVDPSHERLASSQRMEATGRVAGVVTHDFNNLLTVIGTYAELLATSSEITAFEKPIQAILEAVDRAGQMTSQLRILGRSAAPRFVVLKLNDAIAEFRPLLECAIGKAIALEVRLSKEATSIRIDPGQLRQLILNLCLNARDAMLDGGRLTIQTGLVENVSEHPNSDSRPYVTLAITDTGVGMSSQVLEKARQPFFTTKPIEEGSGLGLSAVETILNSCGGLLRLETAPSKGTTVHVFFPIAS